MEYLDSLSKNRFQEKISKEMKDDNYTKYNRGLNELHERALLVIKKVRKFRKGE